MTEADVQKVFLCSQGHRANQAGICTQDGSSFVLARYVCEYCDYATQASKTGKCPNCDAQMKVFEPGEPGKPEEKVSAA